jgi:hypothetical protein
LNFEMPLCHEPTPQSAQELPQHAKGRPFGTMRAIPVSGAIYPAGLILSPLSAATIFGRRRLVPLDHDHGNQKPYGENDRRNRIETMARGRMRCECCAGHWRSSLRCRRERDRSLSHRRLAQNPQPVMSVSCSSFTQIASLNSGGHAALGVSQTN